MAGCHLSLPGQKFNPPGLTSTELVTFGKVESDNWIQRFVYFPAFSQKPKPYDKVDSGSEKCSEQNLY